MSIIYTCAKCGCQQLVTVEGKPITDYGWAITYTLEDDACPSVKKVYCLTCSGNGCGTTWFIDFRRGDEADWITPSEVEKHSVAFIEEVEESEVA